MTTSGLSSTSMTVKRSVRSHLRRGEADALREVHRLEHVFHERAKLARDLLDGRRLLAEDRVAQYPNIENAHSAGVASFEFAAAADPLMRAIRRARRRFAIRQI